MIKIDNIHNVNKNKVILNNIDIELHNDTLNVLLGMNGSGKTSLMDYISQQNKINGTLFSKNNKIIYMTQKMFFAHNTKGKDIYNLIRSLSGKRDLKEIILNELNDEEVEKFDHVMDINVGNMSEGEKKWLYIMLLTNVDREIYFFDEPTSGVDPISKKMIIKRILNIPNENKYCLFSTHQLQEVDDLKGHIIFMNHGNKMFEGNYDKWLKQSNSINAKEAFEHTIEQNNLQLN